MILHKGAVITKKMIEDKTKKSTYTLDFNKIKALKFSEVKDLTFDSIYDFAASESDYQAMCHAYTDSGFYTYKYILINKILPTTFYFQNIDIEKFIKNLFKYNDISESAYVKSSEQTYKNPSLTKFIICFKKDLYIHFTSEESGTIYYNKKDEEDKDSMLYKVLGLLKTCRKTSIEKNKIWVVYHDKGGFDKMAFDIKRIEVNLEENYNDGFVEVSQKIINGLNTKKKTHLVILHGVIGSGKTQYIRYLTSKLKKHIIFLPPEMVNSITDPSFIPFLMNNNNSILVVEDAEPALEKRSAGGRNSAISNVLNMTDGLLSDCLNISIIATFNVDTKNIDEALLRKGRLLTQYKFEKLCVEKSKALLKKLGHGEIEVKEPMTLADIYYYSENNNGSETSSTKKKIGFKI